MGLTLRSILTAAPRYSVRLTRLHTAYSFRILASDLEQVWLLVSCSAVVQTLEEAM
jgi:hypothetical protein